jgi:hypothetical protein
LLLGAGPSASFLELLEASMPSESRDPRTFTDMVLALLENRFPWFETGSESVSGADTIETLGELHRSLLEHATARHAHDT